LLSLLSLSVKMIVSSSASAAVRTPPWPSSRAPATGARASG
jgi:hypothetical protein